MDQINYEDFAKLELKIGEITAVHEIPGADKLYHLEVDTGEPRELVAGIKEHYQPEELVGQQIVVLTNLKPIKLRGVKSNGMLLAAQTPDASEIVLLGPAKSVLNGSSVS